MRQYGCFLGKRIIRLDPTYIVDICLTLALAYFVYLAPILHDPPPSSVRALLKTKEQSR